jgi:hypothetical protein
MNFSLLVPKHHNHGSNDNQNSAKSYVKKTVPKAQDHDKDDKKLLLFLHKMCGLLKGTQD